MNTSCHCCNPGRRRMLRTSLAAGLAGAAWARGWPATAAPSPGLGAGIIHEAVGEVRVNGARADTGMPVAAGDRVSTGSDAHVIFSIGDDGFLLRAAGEVRVSDFGNDPATGRLVRELSLENGRVLSVFGPKQITLKTPFANVGIRGSAAYLECDARSMNICVCYGHAVMNPIGATSLTEEVRNRHHDTPRLITRSHRGVVMEKYQAINHNDDELIKLERMFGRVPAFLKTP